MTTQDILPSFMAAFCQIRVEDLPALKARHGNHEVAPRMANHALDLAPSPSGSNRWRLRRLTIPLARTAKAVLEQIMGLEPAERLRPLSRAVRQNARHQAFVVIVEDRLRHTAEEGKTRVMAVQPGLRRRRWVGLHKALIAVGKVHDEEGDVASKTVELGDDRARLLAVARVKGLRELGPVCALTGTPSRRIRPAGSL